MSRLDDPLPAGTRVNDRYRLTSMLGCGANGQVHRAYDEHLAVHVAIKLLNPIDGQPATWDEAQNLELLQSEYLLRVYNADIVQGSDIRFITTPIMEGGDLEKMVEDNWVNTRLASRWGQQIANGLERMHSAGLLHRDLKPGNVYLDSTGDTKLGDMGMAVRMDADGHALPNGTVVTAAPEVQRSGSPYCSTRSDIYSLAATVFFLLSGEYPVDRRGRRLEEIRDRVVAGQIRNLRDVAPHVSSSLARVIMRSLSLNPDNRASSALEFANKLATAKHYTRDWARVTHHQHVICLRGDRTKTAKPVNVCAIPTAGKIDICISWDSGRQVHKPNLKGISPASLAATIRKVISKL